MAGISVVYVLFGRVPVVEALFYGLKPAVMAIVAGAVLRIGKKSLRNRVMWTLAALSFCAIFFLNIPFPIIILGAGLIGLAGGKWRPGLFDMTASHGPVGAAHHSVIDDAVSANIKAPTVLATVRTVGFWAVLWLLPVVVCVVLLGPQHVLTREGLFFSKAAVVTFGGAYAVLPYVAQQAVENYGWLTAAQMMDGLGLAETTPGPLILVLQFVGFLGGWTADGVASPLVTALLAAGLTSWVTFMPGFLFIFAGAPYIERSRGNSRLNSALSAVTAAVVGVVLNLSVWFAWHVIVPVPGQLDWIAGAAALVFFVLLQRFKWDVLAVVGAGAAFGLVLHVLGVV